MPVSIIGRLLASCGRSIAPTAGAALEDLPRVNKNYVRSGISVS